MDQPQQSFSWPSAVTPGLPLEVTVVSDGETTRRLSRVLALARLRSPYTWGFVLLIPLIVMSRRIVQVFIAANSPGWSVSGLIMSYLGLLAVVVVLSLLAAGVQMLKRNTSIAAYTSPGTPLSARFRQDSLELALITGTVTIAYDEIKDLTQIGGGVILRQQGTRGLALPRALFPDAALGLMRRSLHGPVGRPSRMSGRRRSVLVIAGVVSLVAVIVAAVVVVQRHSSGGDTNGALPDPCVLSDKEQTNFGLVQDSSRNDEKGRDRRCIWTSRDRSFPTIFQAVVIVNAASTPRRQGGQPYRLGSAANGVDAQEILSDDPHDVEAQCALIWTTSFGYVDVRTSAVNKPGLDAAAVCRRTEVLANTIFAERWH